MARYARPNLSPKAESQARHIFKTLATMAETFVFVYIGVSVFIDEQHWHLIKFVVSNSSLSLPGDMRIVMRLMAWDWNQLAGCGCLLTFQKLSMWCA